MYWKEYHELRCTLKKGKFEFSIIAWSEVFLTLNFLIIGLRIMFPVYPNPVTWFRCAFFSTFYSCLQEEEVTKYIKSLLLHVISVLSIKTSPVVLNLWEILSVMYLQQADSTLLHSLLIFLWDQTFFLFFKSYTAAF